MKKTKYDITIVCDRPGFDQATYIDHSGAAGATFGNIVVGGGIGWAIDSASGADNKYDSPVNLTMVPKAAVVRPASPTPPLVGYRSACSCQRGDEYPEPCRSHPRIDRLWRHP